MQTILGATAAGWGSCVEAYRSGGTACEPPPLRPSPHGPGGEPESEFGLGDVPAATSQGAYGLGGWAGGYGWGGTPASTLRMGG